MSDRSFGVEFEFGIHLPNKWHTGNSKRSDVQAMLAHHGFDEYDWSIHGDGTEYEIPSPVLSGEEGLNRLKEFVTVLKENGAYNTDYDGLHVHHDAPEFIGNHRAIVALVENWMGNQDEIMRMAHPRRNNGGACHTWDKRRFDMLRADKSLKHYYGRRNLNISALNEHGTIEIRLHEGTLDFEEISSWIQFGQAFIENVVDNFGLVAKHADIGYYLQRIKVERNAMRFLSRKAGVVRAV